MTVGSGAAPESVTVTVTVSQVGDAESAGQR